MPRTASDKRFQFDVATFEKAVRHAAVELNTTPHAICVQCDINPSTFHHMGAVGRDPRVSTVLGLCAMLGLNPMDYVVDTDQAPSR